MRNYTEEQLMAYADGELPAEEARAIAQQAQHDPELARRIERYAVTRRVLQRTLSGAPEQPVPERLLRAVREPVADKVVPLRRKVRPRVWVPAALAASLALAIGLSVTDWWPDAAPPSAQSLASLPYNARALSRVLETRASGVPESGESGGVRYEILPVASLRTADGAYCREFESLVFEEQGVSRARGLACRQPDGQWAARALVAAPGAGSETPSGYVPAAGDTPGLDPLPAGAVRLSPLEEAHLIDHNWNNAAR